MATITVNVNASFSGLSDTPNSYTGQAGKFVVVKGTEDGVEFQTLSADNLFTDDLTLAANRTHDLNGNSVTFLKSNFEFRALNGNSGERVFGLRNHTNTGWAFEVRNNLDIIANGGSNNDNITSIGYLSGKAGNANTFFGRSAGQASSTGQDNTMIGYTAGLSCSTGNQNVFIGSSAGSNTNGSYNVYVGALAAFLNSGSGNTVIGAGQAASSGTGSQNCFIGFQVALYASSGGENCAIGRASLLSLGTGSGNIAMGQDSGAYRGVGFDSNANPSNSIFLGAYSRANDSNQTNQIVIGHNAIGEGSNTARIGNSSLTELHVGGNGAALALKSPNGTTWRISVDNSGTLVIV